MMITKEIFNKIRKMQYEIKRYHDIIKVTTMFNKKRSIINTISITVEKKFNYKNPYSKYKTTYLCLDDLHQFNKKYEFSRFLGSKENPSLNPIFELKKDSLIKVKIRDKFEDYNFF